MRRITPYLEERDGELHLDTRKFLEHHGYAVTPANERLAIEQFKAIAREVWGDIEMQEVVGPMPSADMQ